MRWLNPDPGFEPVVPTRPLNRYQTRKTQRKENIYGYTGGGDATPWEPVNYAGIATTRATAEPPEIASEPESAPLGPGRRAQGHGDLWRALRPPTLTDDPGLDIGKHGRSGKK